MDIINRGGMFMNKVKYVVMTLLAIVLFFPLAYASANTPTLYVNNKAVPAKEGQPYMIQQSAYVPLKAVVTRMGGTMSYDKSTLTATVRLKDKTTIKFQAGKSYAVINGKARYLVWKKEKGVKYPTSHASQIRNGVFYVPAQFLRDEMKYPLEVKRVNGKTVVYVGQLPKQTTKPATPTKPVTDPDEKAKQEFLKTWTPPKIQSKMTKDPIKNMEILDRELGFFRYDDTSKAAVYSPFGKGSSAPWSFGVSEDTGIPGVDLKIVISRWNGNRWNPEFYKTPFIMKEVLKFYEIPGLYEILEKGYSGKDVDQYLDKPLRMGDRMVTISNPREQVIIKVKFLK